MGQLVNITSKGLMLTAAQPIDANLVYQLELVLTAPRDATDRVNFGAESLWCRQTGDNSCYWTGFQIIDISVETVDFINDLTEGWKTEG